MELAGSGPRALWVLVLALHLTCIDLGRSGNARAEAQGLEGCSRTLPSGRTWSDQEQWVWAQLCAGEVADLDSRPSAEAEDVVGSAPGRPNWSDQSVLSAEFLRALVESPLEEALKHKGIEIRGARFEAGETLDLSFVRFDRRIVLEEALFRGNVRIRDAVLGDSLSLRKSVVQGSLDVGGAKIARDLLLEGITVQGRLRLRGLKVGRNLDFRNGTSLGAVDLIGGRISGDLRLSGSTFRDRVDMSNIEVDRHLFARRYRSAERLKPTRFRSSVVLRNASIGGRMELIGVRLRGLLNMDAIRVEEDIFLRDCSRFGGDIKLVFARIGQNLDLSGSQLQSVDATGARIAGELRLGSLRHPKPSWSPAAVLNLRNVNVFSWQQGEKQEVNSRLFRETCEPPEGFGGPWPQNLELNGFDYQQLGGLGGSGESDMLSGKQAGDLVEGWLKRDDSYSPQPYEQLAEVLTSAGYKDMAKDVLYASKEQERGHAGGTDWLWLTTLKLTMGYGYRYSYALYWVGVLVGLGMLVLRFTHEGRRHKMPIGFFYSLDLLLPIVRLRDYHHQIQLRGYARYYFYFHKLVGYFLASILIAGFSGLTK